MTESLEEPNKDAALDDEGKRLMERARQAFDKGETLPAPKTWREYLVGVVVWVATHWHTEPGEVGDYRCPVCSSTNWTLGQVVGLASDSRWPQPDSGKGGSFPCAQIECAQCGHLQLLDALKVFEPQESATDSSS